jgi:putative restriction endonuclease
MTDGEGARLLDKLMSLRQHQHDGNRSPHKPLLVLLALGELAASGSSALAWSAAEERLASLIAEFGPPSSTGAAQSAAYPFTRLRSDGVWTLSEDVPMDRVGPLSHGNVVGRLDPLLEAELADTASLLQTARALADAEFPATLAGDVLVAVGLDPDLATAPVGDVRRGRSSAWPSRVLAAWDRQCAFCGFDGQLGGGSVGLEAAHVRWFNFGGPDELNNGLALCSLHHKLLDRGVLGLTTDHSIKVSTEFSARTPAGRRIYELADVRLTPRPGTALPAPEHLHWHDRQVFKGTPLAT